MEFTKNAICRSMCKEEHWKGVIVRLANVEN
jgi:hypothetical protein